MTLTRDDLENDRLRQMFRTANPGVRVLAESDFESQIGALLAQQPRGADIWLFGYGSLIWNPIVRFEERCVARLHGYHRRFCLWSHVGRGSPQKPGLVLGLDSGGSCRGIAFRIAGHQANEELRLLWRREMVIGAYDPRWITADAGGKVVRAIAFIVRRDHPSYAGKLPIETVVKNMLSTRGYLGTPVEYLTETVRGLNEHGVRDAYLLDLRRRVLAAHAEAAR